MGEPTIDSDTVARDQIRAFVERIERLHEERTAIGRNISEVFAEAKANGFDVKALKIVISKRRQDHAERLELEAIVELYEVALGMSTGGYGDDEKTGTPIATRAPAQEHDSADDGEHQSTAALKEVQDETTGDGPGKPSSNPAAGTTQPSGYQAPPVDTNPVANVEEGANGAIAAASDDPASRSEGPTDGHPVSSLGFGGQETGGVLETVPPAPPSNITPFRKHDGPVSSKGLPRQISCQNLEACAGKWDKLCFTCARAMQVETAGVCIPHGGQVA